MPLNVANKQSSYLYSHPSKLLEDHLQNVVQLISLFFDEQPAAIRKNLKNTAIITGLTHDLGKATNFFQAFLSSNINRDENGTDCNSTIIKKSKLSSHSFLSAICAFNLSKEKHQEYIGAMEEKFEEKKMVKEQLGCTYKSNAIKIFNEKCEHYTSDIILIEPDFLPLVAFLTVARHHGDLRDISFETISDDSGDEKVENAKQQIENIDYNKFSIVVEKLFGTKEKINKDKLLLWVNDFSKEITCYKRYIRQHIYKDTKYQNAKLFLGINLIFSLLIDADKSDVVIKNLPAAFERKKIFTSDWVDNYKSKMKFANSDINIIREKAYREAIGKLKTDEALGDFGKYSPDKKIYSLNLPTGTGKTLISFSCALKLKEMMKHQCNMRIIYSLPYLSIIEQNSHIFESVIISNNMPASSDILIKHHHLSEIFYKTNDNEFEIDEAKILLEGWNSEIIVTTFMQLFYTLISNKNSNLRKFHRISNSIIILDEVQSIPIKYWNMLRTVLLEISELLNVYIILSTATEPLIFSQDEIINIVNKTSYFSQLDRISIFPQIKQPMTLSDLYNYFFADNISASSKHSINSDKKYPYDNNIILFIFNTISSAKEFYCMLKEKNHAESVAYLSTHIIPEERLNRINNIKKGKYKYAVSTQLVEAGVDIDFNIVVRDIAPLDSINQSSGRCNRNWSGHDRGKVYIVNLINENGKRYADYIYDPVLLDITGKILGNKEEIRESEFLSLINMYYEEVKKKKNQDVNISNAIYNLIYDNSRDNGKKPISDFKLIENDFLRTDAFIEIDNNKASLIWAAYCNLKNINNRFERKKEFDKIKSDFYKYVISIPSNIKNNPPMYGEIGYVKNSILRDYYDAETGFILEDTRLTAIF
jgi:CRISPR-associated endonuclease/helicase Cas3